MRTRTHRRTVIALACAAIAAPLAAPAAASAGLLTGLLGGGGLVGSVLYTVDDLVDGLLTGRTALTAKDCAEPVLGKPFEHDGDLADYFLVSGGDFMTAAGGWQVRDGTIAGGALRLEGDRAAAVSPKVCVGHLEPTMRFRYASGGDFPILRIDALFLGTRGELRSDHVTTLYGEQSWAPSDVIQIGTNYRARRGEKTAIALVFTVQSGSWAIDDVYVDPFRSR